MIMDFAWAVRAGAICWVDLICDSGVSSSSRLDELGQQDAVPRVDGLSHLAGVDDGSRLEYFFRGRELFGRGQAGIHGPFQKRLELFLCFGVLQCLTLLKSTFGLTKGP